ncbi:MAG: NYN domain-containing protein [Chloroflexota bacterium]
MPQGNNIALALLIDGDNAEAKLLPQILAEVSKYGTAIIRRVYGDWEQTQMKSWKEVLHTHALKPVQQFRYTTGKNATDIALVIDAMDILHTSEVGGFCIVSSDSDYTRLAIRIREQNLFVLGIGRRLTPSPFVSACNVFVYTENLKQNDSASPDGTAEDASLKRSGKKHKQMISLFDRAFDIAVQDSGWAHLGAMGNALHQIDPGFDPRTYGHKQLSQLMEAHPDIFDVRKSGPNKTVYYIRMKTN